MYDNVTMHIARIFHPRMQTYNMTAQHNTIWYRIQFALNHANYITLQLCIQDHASPSWLIILSAKLWLQQRSALFHPCGFPLNSILYSTTSSRLQSLIITICMFFEFFDSSHAQDLSDRLCRSVYLQRVCAFSKLVSMDQNWVLHKGVISH